MFFIALLILATTSIAGAAAYFSVYGLAYTFSGVFWSVVAMGASLEAGKLIAASYLYRYWHDTSILLKSYLMLGVAALMLMTSVGIFGYLSSGYQQDVLPLKQKTEQVTLLEEEKARLLTRKRQIDDIIAGSATVSTVEGAKGIDRNAVRALRETTRARESLVKQYKTEQSDVTARIRSLDAELLALKQDLIKTEAHIGPITYIAKAFGQPTDDATKWLIFLIIFAFDPMAVALTIAVNNALRIREQKKSLVQPTTVLQPPAQIEGPETVTIGHLPNVETLLSEQQPLSPDMTAVLNDNVRDLYEHSEAKELPPLEFETPPAPVNTNASQQQLSDIGSPRRSRPYPNLVKTSELSQDKIKQLVDHYKYLQKMVDEGRTITKDEMWELTAIKDVLQKAGFGHYLQ